MNFCLDRDPIDFDRYFYYSRGELEESIVLPSIIVRIENLVSSATKY